MITVGALERDVVIVACAVSAGIHAAFVRGHFAEGAGLGLGFAAATFLLTGLVLGLSCRPGSSAAVAGAAVVLAGLIACYGLATTTGIPLLHPGPEPVDGLALATKAIEAAGLLAALHLLWHGRVAMPPTLLRPKGTLT